VTGALASHYARALADAVTPPDSGLDPRKAVEQLRRAECLLSSSKDLQLVLVSPLISKTEKFNVIRRLADQFELHRTIRNFLLIIASHRRTKEIRRIVTQFEQIVNERLRLTAVEVTSRRELTGSQKEEIERLLGEKLGKAIQVDYKLDSCLLGGVKASVASKEYDATIRGGLERLRARLLATV
jgi:F-type H+-transporting ATPase subunit delta